MFNDPYVKNSSEKAAYHIFFNVRYELDKENKTLFDDEIDEVLQNVGAEELTNRVNAVKFEDIEVCFPVPKTWKLTKRSFNMGKKLILDKIATLDK